MALEGALLRMGARGTQMWEAFSIILQSLLSEYLPETCSLPPSLLFT